MVFFLTTVSCSCIKSSSSLIAPANTHNSTVPCLSALMHEAAKCHQPFFLSGTAYFLLALLPFGCLYLLSLLVLAPFSLLLQVLLVFLAHTVFIFHYLLPLSAQQVSHLLPFCPLNVHFLFFVQFLCLPSGPNKLPSSDLLFFAFSYTQNYNDLKPIGLPHNLLHLHV